MYDVSALLFFSFLFLPLFVFSLNSVLQPVTGTGPGTASSNWTIPNATASYLYVYFPHFQGSLSYDPNFGILTGGGGGVGDGSGGGGAGDGATVGIAVGVTVPAVLIGMVAIMGTMLGLMIWQRHRIVTRVRAVALKGGV